MLRIRIFCFCAAVAVALPSAPAGADEIADPRLSWSVRSEGATTAVAVSPDGATTYVAEHSRIVAYAAPTGAALWQGAAPNPGSYYWLAPKQIVTSRDGRTVFVSGISYSDATSLDHETVAYDAASGAVRWRSVHAQRGNEIPGDMTISPDGSAVFVTLTAGWDSHSTGDLITIAYDAATGDEAWLARFDSGSRDDAHGIVVSPDGSHVYVAGSIDWFEGARRAVTLAYSAQGDEVWRAVSNTYSRARGIAISPDGASVFMTGWEFSKNDLGADDIVAMTVAYAAQTGVVRWAAAFDAPALYDEDHGTSVVVSPDGSRLFVSIETRSYPSPVWHGATVAYRTSDGRAEWSSFSSAPATDLTISGDGGRLYATRTAPSVTVRTPYEVPPPPVVAPDPTCIDLEEIFGSNCERPYPWPNAGVGGDIETSVIESVTGVELTRMTFAGTGGDDLSRALAVSPDMSALYVVGLSDGSASPTERDLQGIVMRYAL